MAADAAWIFGYGSLVWRPAFPMAERHPGYVRGYQRRFWQGSTDHRGVPGAPGRVVTLLPCAPELRCWGAVYRIEPGREAAVLAGLDYREKGGYERHRVTVERPEAPPIEAFVYLATPANEEWLGEAPLDQMVDQISASVGPSGSNREYLLRLHAALVECGGEDDHVDALVRALNSRG